MLFLFLVCCVSWWRSCRVVIGRWRNVLFVLFVLIVIFVLCFSVVMVYVFFVVLCLVFV